MKKIIRIARVELSNLFYSPIAWLLLGIFLVQCGVTFSDLVASFLQRQRMTALFPSAPSSATFTILTDKYNGFFTQIVAKLYFYLPLITMGLISREVSSGSIKLLYSSPVKTSQIVLGKFLSMVYYNLMLIIVLTIFTTVATFIIPHAETGVMYAGLFAFFLLLCTYAAIGLFMSCLTSYQVVAALSTLAVFAFLNYIGTVWQNTDLVRDLTYFLSLGNRTQDMFDGLLTSRDILYFLIITGMFLGFSMLRLKAEQEYRPGWIRALSYVTIFVVALGLGYVTSRPAAIAYWDVTKQKVNTLSNSTQELLKSTGDEPLELTAYVNLLDMRYMNGAPKARNSYLRTWEKYTRFKEIKYNFYYYYDTSYLTSGMMERSYKGKTLRDVAEDFAKLNKVPIARFNLPEDTRKYPVLKGEDGKMILELSYKGKTAPLRVYDDRDIWPFESQFNATLKRVMNPASTPRVAFLTGQFQREPFKGGDRNYAIFAGNKAGRSALTNQGFDLLMVNEGEEIPNDLTALVVADPKSAFSEDRLDKLRKYIIAGGNLLIATEPNKQEIINPLLKELGVEMQSGVIVSRNNSEVPTIIPSKITRAAANMSQGISGLGNSNVFVNVAGALEYKDTTKGFTAEPLLTTLGNKAQWLKKGHLVSDSALVEYNESEGDLAGTFTSVLGLKRMQNGREQRIIVSGDGDLVANLTLQKFANYNVPFSLGMFKWFSNGSFPVELSTKPILDTKLNLTDEGLDRLKIVLLWVLPAILIISGTVLLLRRKRK